ncbi:unnamed protein product [Sphenostylis stenocarpa]|uniref:DNA-directed RNA polymerase III subunit RPC4 n=1 Tax=Sphenostylis stenocarpa TaxID=92480 RepID=A0AA86VDK8_9FABA|nr:unnamed protein product [Sphenostylis stenocarpa]
MDPDQSSRRTRKHKYTPRPPKPQAPKSCREADDKQDEDCTPARLLSRRYENHARREIKVERKSSVEVAFSPGISSTSLRTFGTSKAIDGTTNSGSPSKYLGKEQIRSRRSSAATEDQNDTSTIDVTEDTTNASARKIKGKYKEPWDYNNSCYPITLPLRKPNSGNPEILDEEEFGEAASSEYDENTVNSAAELELLEQSEQPKMFLFQLPKYMPFNEKSNKGKEEIGASTVSGKAGALEELPRGYMGKMQVYKSGAVKLKLGETVFDVSPGTDCKFAQDVVAVNNAQKNICNLGEISKKVVIVPDLDSIDLTNTQRQK